MTAEPRIRRLGVRAGVTLIAAIVVGIAFSIGAVLLLVLAEQRIEDGIIDGAAARALSLVTLAEADALTDPLAGSDPDYLAQVVGPDGRVITADRAVRNLPALVATAVAPGSSASETSDDLLEPYEELGIEDEGPYRVLVYGVSLPNGPGRVIVAASLEPAVEARRAVVPILGFGLPLLFLIVSATTWFLAGRALRPVELMRREALEISATDPGRRLTVPAARDEVQRLALSLNEMLQRLHDAVERQRRFTADASHELRSPLAAIRTMIEVTLGEADAADRHGALEDIADQFDRIERLIADLLVLASHDEGRRMTAAVELDLDQIAGRVGAEARLRHDLAVDLSGIEPVAVHGEADRLERLVRNLVDNAARHARSTIRLATFTESEIAVLRVADDGPGVPAGERERIFERFVRLDESRSRDSGGAGLGLAVVRAVAEEHGGSVAVVDLDSPGAAFEVRLPAAAG